MWAIAWGLSGCLSQPDPGGNPPITHVGAFGSADDSADSISATLDVANAGDAVVAHVFCGSSSSPRFTLTGLDFAPLDQDGNENLWVASFGAITTEPSSVTISATGTNCGALGMVLIGDEFHGTSTAGGSATFDAAIVKMSLVVSPTAAQITTNNDNDAVWAAATVGGQLTGPGSGFDGGGSAAGNFSEYKITTARAGTHEDVSFQGVPDVWIMTLVTLAQ